MTLKNAFAFVLALSASTQCVFAVEKWNCVYAPKGDNNSATRTQYELRNGTELYGPVEDYSGKRTIYDVIENTKFGLIAISHYSTSANSGVVVLLLNKNTGVFRLVGMLANDDYDDTHVGSCIRDGLKRPD